MKIPKTKLDYVEFYAKKIKENPKLFKQHKEMIDSQLESSSEIMKKRFSGKDFKTSARRYLKNIGLI